MTLEPLPTTADDPPTRLGAARRCAGPGDARPGLLGAPGCGPAARLPPVSTERLARVRSLPGLPAATLTGIALGLALVSARAPGHHDVYTESWLFLVLAVGLGALSPGAGLLLVLAFVPMDLLAVVTRGQLDPANPGAGRTVRLVVAAVAARGRAAARRAPGAPGRCWPWAGPIPGGRGG